MDEIARRHGGGETLKSLSLEYGIPYPTLRYRFGKRTTHVCVCVVCGANFTSVHKARLTCSVFCRSQRAGKSPSKRTCQCGQPASKKGYCKGCSLERKRQSRRNHYRRNAERIIAEHRLRYYSYAAEHRAKVREVNTELRFNNNRKARLEFDDYMCQSCGTKEDLVVHHKHIDPLRRASRRDDKSTLDDLLTLCRSCHLKLHVEQGDIQQSP
jgi:hypothetical protein